jgi:hypothetical protein
MATEKYPGTHFEQCVKFFLNVPASHGLEMQTSSDVAPVTCELFPAGQE